MSKQFAVIPLNFDVLTFTDKSLEKYKEKIGVNCADSMYFSIDVISNLRKLETYLMDCDSYFLVPIGENSFSFMLKENAKLFIDLPDCEFSISRRD